MKRRRLLTPEERELWEKVAASTHALHPHAPISAETAPDRGERHIIASPPPRPEVPEFRIGEAARGPVRRHDIAPSLSEALQRQAVQMDRKTHREMTRGKLEPEAKIDLHGMTLAEAHPELIHFILRAQARGARLVLVITGKGKRGRDEGPIPQRPGVLRHQVPHWLRLPPLGPVVLQVNEAHLRHGGGGAYYVYLRRAR
ncbi:Smr/MutS family protein [Rhodobacter maris]|uniref:DNA-nicking Smr family endonuclease n=1 Tax=Rhodobacter maris TaxID=446682 RepID=A0A285SGD1_9RHOB|nr:Smr/MutS family protein [Rhodobacter maris]SOC06649.1 DNA-nicking Smr family endonuclease [Rhodobacter maris]